jgi:hypothetical protein
MEAMVMGYAKGRIVRVPATPWRGRVWCESWTTGIGHEHLIPTPKLYLSAVEVEVCSPAVGAFFAAGIPALAEGRHQ